MKVDHHIQQYYITENWYVHVILFPWNNIKKYIYFYESPIEPNNTKKLIAKWMPH